MTPTRKFLSKGFLLGFLHLYPNRSPKKAAAGTIIPAANIYPEVSHCTLDKEALNTSIMIGSATLNIVVFRALSNPPKPSASKIRYCFFVK